MDVSFRRPGGGKFAHQGLGEPVRASGATEDQDTGPQTTLSPSQLTGSDLSLLLREGPGEKMLDALGEGQVLDKCVWLGYRILK